jgi:hypothetical protein
MFTVAVAVASVGLAAAAGGFAGAALGAAAGWAGSAAVGALSAAGAAGASSAKAGTDSADKLVRMGTMVRIFIAFPQAGRPLSGALACTTDLAAPMFVRSRFDDASKDKCGNSSSRLPESSARKVS